MKVAPVNSLGGGQLGKASNADLLFAFAGLRDVIGGLHAHQRIHLYAKGFFDAEGHVPGEVGLGVEQAR